MIARCKFCLSLISLAELKAVVVFRFLKFYMNFYVLNFSLHLIKVGFASAENLNMSNLK